MINKFSNGGKVLILAVFATLLASQAFAGFGGVSSYAGSFTRTINPASAADFQKGPRIITEKTSYLASESVRINGEDFEGYERVRFAVGVESKDGTSGLVIGQWDVYADGKGRISTTWDVPADGGSFVVTATGDVSGMTAKTTINSLIAESVKLAQCANTNAVMQNLDCPSGGPAGWVTGLVGSSKARYYEGDFIAYRNVMEGLTPGSDYKWTVAYDTSKGGLNAIDYLADFDETMTGANPCADGATVNGFCTAGPAPSSFAVPVDPKVANGRDQTAATIDDITPIAGSIKAWGGTITAVSVPVYTGTFPGGDSTASVNISFTAGASTVVIAWGGHISTRTDWGQAFGSVNISGAPYHSSNGGLMNLTAQTSCCGGSQDLQLSAVAVVPTAKLTIIKQASPESAFSFGFTTTGLSVASFSLVDDGNDNDATPNFIVIDGISTFGSKTITESSPAPYSLQSATCDGGTPSLDGPTRTLTVNVQSGNNITCTFNNSFLTAAEAIVTGRVMGPNGNPLANAWVSGTDGNGNTSYARTNQFGYYSIRELEAGTSLFLAVAHKSYDFPSSFVTLNDETTTVNFNGSPR